MARNVKARKAPSKPEQPTERRVNVDASRDDEDKTGTIDEALANAPDPKPLTVDFEPDTAWEKPYKAEGTTVIDGGGRRIAMIMHPVGDFDVRVRGAEAVAEALNKTG